MRTTTDRPLSSPLATLPATAVVRSAADFGLTAEEICQTVTATLDRLPSGARDRCIDELAGALAQRLLEKERRFTDRR